MIRLLLSAMVATALFAGPTKPAPGEAVPYQTTFKAMGGALWVPRAAQAQAESGFDPLAQSWIINKQGVKIPCAFGLCQFTMPTWKTWGDPGASPLQPVPCIKAQCRYMPWLSARVGGDPDKTLAAYNAGLGSVQRAERMAASLGLLGPTAWLQALPRVTGVANAAQTTGYLQHNHANIVSIQRKVGNQ
jgi:soluble lytic murein transglycosylase-like protein